MERFTFGIGNAELQLRQDVVQFLLEPASDGRHGSQARTDGPAGPTLNETAGGFLVAPGDQCQGRFFQRAAAQVREASPSFVAEVRDVAQPLLFRAD